MLHSNPHWFERVLSISGKAPVIIILMVSNAVRDISVLSLCPCPLCFEGTSVEYFHYLHLKDSK